MARNGLGFLSLLVFLLAGCGGSGGSSAGSTAAGSTGGGGTNTTPPQWERVSHETIDEGPGSARGFNLGAHEVHAGTDADWVALWSSHSQAALPTVDFAQESVVGTFMGQIGGGSHFTQVVGVSRDLNSDDLHALVREFRLGAWKPNTKNITSPFHIVRCDAAVSGQGTLHVDRQALLDFETFAAGSNSAIGANDPTYTGELRVIRDATELTAFYAQHQPGTRPPGFDFSREMIVAVLGGYIPSFGNSVQTLRILHDVKSDELRVVYRVNPYRGGAAPPPATETPFQLLRVTRATGAIREEVRTPLTHTRLASGSTPLHTGAAEQLVIRDAAAFSALWTARIGGPVPQVDFSVDQVVAAFEAIGTQRTVSISRVEEWEDSDAFVRVNTSMFLGTPATEASYSVVTTPRTFGPTTFDVIDTTPRP